jgi:hypothetical protein
VQTLVAIVVAYVFTLLTYAVAGDLSRLPTGPLWDVSFQAPVFVVLIAVVVCVLLVPFFQREVSPQVRTFAGFAIAFIVAFAVLQSFHIADPAQPMRLLIARFDAYRKQFGL